jgi:hypothetical protein
MIDRSEPGDVMQIDELGNRVSEHPTDSRRRLRNAGVLCAVSAGALGLGVPLIIIEVSTPLRPGEPPRTALQQALGGLVALGVVMLFLGVVHLVKARRTRDETFELYERGLVHRVADRVSIVAWPHVASVRLHGAVRSGLAHWLGTDFSCVLRLTNRQRIRFDTLTTNAPELAAAIDAAVNQGVNPTIQ